MNTPLVWILIPGALAVVLLALQRWERMVVILGTLGALVLALLAGWLPVKDQYLIGPWTVGLTDTWTILGRQFVLGANDRPALVALYLATAFWCGAVYVARTKSGSVPLALGMVSLLTAAMAVEPFPFAALLIEIAVLVSIPLITPGDGTTGRGVLRYLTLLTLGMPFILITGWMMTGIEANPADEGLVLSATILMGLGFALQLAFFPFHTWIPMLGRESHPYAVAFIFLMIPGAITLIGLDYFDRFEWLGASQNAYLLLRAVGVLMVVFAGLWAAFQQHLGSMLGYAAILEIGLSLVVIGLGENVYADKFLGVFYATLLPRGLGLGLWALALTVIRSQAPGLHYQDVQGIALLTPMAAGSLVFAQFSLAGLPLLASFPARLAMWDSLVQVSPWSAFLALIGCMGLLVGGLRTLAVLVMGTEREGWKVTETRAQQLFLGIGTIGLLVMGLFPHWFLPILANMPQNFGQLAP